MRIDRNLNEHELYVHLGNEPARVGEILHSVSLNDNIN